MDSMSAIVDFFSSGKNEIIRVGDPDAIEKFYKAIIDDGYDLSEMKEEHLIAVVPSLEDVLEMVK